MKHPEHTTRYVTITEDEYESLQRTIEVITDSELMDQLKKSKEDIKEGRVSDWDEFMKERGVE